MYDAPTRMLVTKTAYATCFISSNESAGGTSDVQRNPPHKQSLAQPLCDFQNLDPDTSEPFQGLSTGSLTYVGSEELKASLNA
ncbi:hypothetical protein COCC4DRAFT_124970 [Bipolaris maydis ATCC 48331]|uniref:Uncharacterized protein n=2 Tax=Cochliobolus heterostrophus TaxID=5016 RepID=M2UNE1_COCH5|nr:uncharacterized protein COCC4DRAFT_124970 [Bipolaris maydis ATCC 48331]EMD89758.1 hypothetical protein COCHEDRAFT_1214811 [Bipolaris maydis C5]EMD95121.1 hypothetical protein COCHEDRAFT_1211106 [Bipolaris maydis C5]ENI10030.1 hypothetical protein COCC4DRAFT_124970 [Bipolaris maydis ATCC 48331]KAH7563377.1 hypothetical protein BM1_00424 [Bipolaris maydis]